MADEIVTVKPCIKCGGIGRKPNGKCKTCAGITTAAWRAKNKERIAAYSASYLASHKEQKRKTNVAWRAANRKHVADREMAYRKANAERIAIAAAAWRNDHPNYFLEKAAAWAKAHPEARRINQHNRSARQRKNGGKLSKGLSDKLFKLQKGKCPCCGKPLGSDFELDHVIPIVRGVVNEDWNMQLLRKLCNSQKRAKHPVDFMQQRGFLI